MRGAALFAIATALVVGSGAASPASTQVEPGLTGKVLRGPTRPVCIFDRPCYAPFKGTLVFTPLSPGIAMEPVRVQTEANGDYNVLLEAMRYRVKTGIRSRFGGLVKPAFVAVPANAVRRVNFLVDTGIR